MVWPSIATDGTVAVLWRDRRNGEGDSAHTATDTYYAYSRDGGKTWSGNIRVSDATAPFLPILAGPGNDFLSGAVEHDTLYAAWADTRTGNLHVYFGKVALGGDAWVGETSLSDRSLVRVVQVSASTITLELASAEPYLLRFFDMLGRELRPVRGSGRKTISIERPKEAMFVLAQIGSNTQLLRLE
jgi:hypothetical protein